MLGLARWAQDVSHADIFELGDDLVAIRDAIRKLMTPFDDAYWLSADQEMILCHIAERALGLPKSY